MGPFKGLGNSQFWKRIYEKPLFQLETFFCIALELFPLEPHLRIFLGRNLYGRCHHHKSIHPLHRGFQRLECGGKHGPGVIRQRYRERPYRPDLPPNPHRPYRRRGEHRRLEQRTQQHHRRQRGQPQCAFLEHRMVAPRRIQNQ